MAIAGESGCGKTFTALAIAKRLVELHFQLTGETRRIAVVDSEHGSSRKYAHLFDFDIL